MRRLFLPLLLIAAACGGGRDTETAAADSGAAPGELPAPMEVTMEPQDSLIFEEKVAWARAQRLDTMSTGAAMAALGRTFVGTKYTAGTLEQPGAEKLVINLRELDCVTFVENMLAIVRILRAGTPDFASYRRELARIRYRDGVLDGYASRLHYFSDWIADNEEKGIVENVTQQLGGVADTDTIDFMTQNRQAYRQLADDAVAAQIAQLETRLQGQPRYYIPKAHIAGIASQIRDGDIIAATSTLDGLDVVHTGLALWQDGRLHLMHAPLVGSSVEISELPLADRIQRISAQDGIMVARPR